MVDERYVGMTLAGAGISTFRIVLTVSCFRVSETSLGLLRVPIQCIVLTLGVYILSRVVLFTKLIILGLYLLRRMTLA